ncbi:MAG: hypothetical protein JKX98_04905 [Alcanivoracaceae bacterium]|nr:hypothetical protein [Alcanivoracaceae bacterium]
MYSERERGSEKSHEIDREKKKELEQIMNVEKVNLQDYTRCTVRQYLQNLKGHQAKNLYNFVIDEIEKGIILEVLNFTNGNRTKTSNILGITRTTLRTKIRKHKL